MTELEKDHAAALELLDHIYQAFDQDNNNYSSLRMRHTQTIEQRRTDLQRLRKNSEYRVIMGGVI